jgi:hypothetical protein
MAISPNLLSTVVGHPASAAWHGIANHVWAEFSAPIPSAPDVEVVKRDRGLTELDNILSGSAWDLWHQFEAIVPKASKGIIDFWNANHGGKAVLILDGLSLREAPWLIEQAKERKYLVHLAEVRGTELPSETTAFAHSLGFSQRSALENNGAGKAHKLKGAYTISCDLPWQDCLELVGSEEAVVFWHHWPDKRMHDLAKAGLGLRKLAKEAHGFLTSEDFWALIDRLATGRRLLITSDHGYAASGEFTDLHGDQATYMKSVFKSGRFASPEDNTAPWVPPIDLQVNSSHGTYQYVLGRRKWKSQSGYPTMQHEGLSLLEVFVPFIELTK